MDLLGCYQTANHIHLIGAKRARDYNGSMKFVGINEMNIEATRFASTLKPSTKGAIIVALEGDLGAGKTTFARAVARHFGVEENVTSPTFVIEKMYKTENGPFARLIHIDAYRLKTAHELDVLGWQEIIAETSNLVLIEWPERVLGAVPAHAITIKFAFVDEGVREIIYAA